MASVLAQPTEGKRFYRTILKEFYQAAFRKKVYGSIGELQKDVDEWLEFYSQERPRSGRYGYGQTRHPCKRG